ncbi:hypothetical protein [Shinella sp.]|uniref:DUF6414 family protein n=1 Tax=Shinella sp. TaxID=1870904 RepID=UPI0028AB4C2B|nr:hypothetical protein [Shinella sp.]
MQETSKNPSEKAPGAQSDDSVFDFLYYDVARTASFLSQFDASGHLTGITSAEKSARKSNISMKDELSGNLAVFKSVKRGEETAETQSERLGTRTYDPHWANALGFLDYLTERDLLYPDVKTARIGQIVRFSGSLSMFDLGLLRQMWSLPAVKKLILAGQKSVDTTSVSTGNRKERRQSTALGAKKSEPQSESEAALELMAVLPHAVQAAVSDDDMSVWMTLKEENIAISPPDLFMKHGLTIAGEWTIVGILDATPDDEDYHPSDGGLSLNTMKQMAAGSKLGYLSFTMASHFAPIIRQLFGRPPESYGFTPLLLFREVSGD